MENLLRDERFSLVSDGDKAFIASFDEEIGKLGYDSGGEIGSGYLWGRYMIIYSRTGVKARRVLARIYLREKGIVLRLFLNRVDEHRRFIEEAPDHIKEAFTGDYGRCRHCKNQREGVCRFRKTYTLGDQFIEMCNGLTFEFREPTVERLPDYMRLLVEFLPHARLKVG